MRPRTSLLAVNDAAEYLAISRWTVYKLVRRGDIRALRVGDRLRFRVEELDRYVEREAVP
jgi:putative molybdopterin biosynthesis protein